MTEMLHRLVYYSRNRIVGSAEQTSAAIAQILSASRRNNPRVGVTGALMFSTGYFAQVLEGPHDAIEDRFERIQQDERHNDVLLLCFEASATRRFENWSMAYIDRTQGPDAARDASAARRFEPGRMTSDQLLKELHELVLDEERALLP